MAFKTILNTLDETKSLLGESKSKTRQMSLFIWSSTFITDTYGP